MNCPLNMSTIASDCAPNIGGVKRIWVGSREKVAINDMAIGYGDCNVEIERAEGVAGVVFVGVTARPALSTITTTLTYSEENETMYFRTVVQAVLNRMNQEKHLFVFSIVSSDAIFVVEDMNGKRWILGPGMEPVFPLLRRVQLTGGSFGSGTQKSDRNGYDLELSWDSAGPPAELTNIDDTMFDTI